VRGEQPKLEITLQGAPLKLCLGGVVTQFDCHPEQGLTATVPKTEFWRIRVRSSPSIIRTFQPVTTTSTCGAKASLSES
jgi:hypothetical protein